MNKTCSTGHLQFQEDLPSSACHMPMKQWTCLPYPHLLSIPPLTVATPSAHPLCPAAFKESLIPRAVEWFTGEISPPMFDDEFEMGEDDDDDFEEPPRRR